MARLSWLHLTDLHRGLADQDHLWPGVENDFYDDIEVLHRQCGPWDLVLFTGDLTQRGTAAEFASLNEILGTLSTRLAALGSNPILLAVPGNHDLLRPVEPVEPAVEVLSQWVRHERAQRAFWTQPDGAYRKVVSAAFAPYEAWWNDPRRPFRRPAPAEFHAGLLPGDYSAVIEKDGLRVGIVGLNSAFLQLEGGDYKERLALHTRQFNAACNNNGPTWARASDVCLLLTHHPPEWLDEPSRKQHYAANIADFFAVHLHGHMHENKATGFFVPGARPRYLSQGCSLFGLETSGDDRPVTRQHGYAAGRIEIDRERAELRLWPRRAVQTDGGPWQIVPDVRFGRLEQDQGTSALPIFRLRQRKEEAEPGRPPLPWSAQPPGNAYDPEWYVPRESAEQRALANLENDGAPATIVWGPPFYGKTWFLQHIQRRVCEQGPPKTAVFEVNIAKLANHLLGDRDLFLRELGVHIARAAGNEPWAAQEWQRLPGNPGQALSLLLERHVLPAVPRALLVLENVHLLLGSPFRDELFKLFRSWNQDASRKPWSKLRLLLGMSIGPELFEQDADVSGFLNSALRIPIGGFKLEHARKLCKMYRLDHWSDDDRHRLLEWVDHHPYLVRLAMYECSDGMSLEELFAPHRTGNMQFFATMARLRKKGA